MKKFLSLLMLCVLLLSMVSCGNTEQPQAEKVRVLTLKGPTGMGMANVWNDANSDTDSKYTFTLFASPDLVKAEVLLGKYDIAALPTNVAAALYNSGKADLQVVAVNTLGVLHIVENGNTVTDIQSLKGKTIHATGGGSTPEFILRYVLEMNGIDPDEDVTLDFHYTDHAQLAGYVKSGTVKIAMLPEPNVTVALTGTENVRVALDLTEEWEKLYGEETLVQGCLVVNKAFADEHPAEIKKFLEDYEASVEFIKGGSDEAINMVVETGILPKAGVVKKALPNCNLSCITGEDMKASIGVFYEKIYALDKQSIGAMPDDGFYYIAK